MYVPSEISEFSRLKEINFILNLNIIMKCSFGTDTFLWILGSPFRSVVFVLFVLLITPDSGDFDGGNRRRRSSGSLFYVEAVSSFGATASPRVIETQYGRLRGVLVTVPPPSSGGGSGSSSSSSSSSGSDSKSSTSSGASPAAGLVEAYLGLQYATLLGGDLRFMPPTSTIEKWDGVRVAHKFRPVCPQPRISDEVELRRRRLSLGRIEHLKRLAPYLQDQDEECLNLNVYVPAKELAGTYNGSSTSGTHPDSGSTLTATSSTSSSALLPVLVFVHGEGSYDIGSGNAYDGSVLAWHGQIIVITINYRLGILGFLSTEDSNAPGNYALLDQVAALHWIKENIEAFGGDPNEVTLMGQGHGAAMVNLLMISPVAKGRNLFRRAILHSGSAMTTWAVASNPLRYAKMVADRLNCTRPDPQQPASTPSGEPSPAAASGSASMTSTMPPSSAPSGYTFLSCLKSLPVGALVDVGIRAPRYLSAFGPTVDGRAVIPEDVVRLTAKTSDSGLASTSLLAGVTRNEGLAFLRQTDIVDGVGADQWKRVLRTYVQNVFDYHRQSIYDVISHQYIDWERSGGGANGIAAGNPMSTGTAGSAVNRDPAVGRDTLLDLLGDGQTVAPLVGVARFHAGHSVPGVSTYVFEFNHPARLDVYPRWATGSPGDELLYVFGAPLTDYRVDPFPAGSYSRNDRVLAESVIRYWSNFVKTGNPNAVTATSDKEPAGRWKGRTHEAIWPVFDNSKQEYLVLERKSPERGDEGVTRQQFPVRHHYRGARMALWLDLLPRLHRSDGLDARFHQLDDFTNQSSFDDNEFDVDGGTRHPDETEQALLQSITKTTVPASDQSPSFDSDSTPNLRRSPTATTYRPQRRPTIGPLSPASAASSGQGQQPKPRNTVNEAAPTPPRPGNSNQMDSALSNSASGDSNALSTAGVASLAATVAVGCALLALNAAIFAAVYVKRDRQRRIRQQQHQAFMVGAPTPLGIDPATSAAYSRTNSGGTIMVTTTDLVNFDAASSGTMLLDNGYRKRGTPDRKSSQISSTLDRKLFLPQQQTSGPRFVTSAAYKTMPQQPQAQSASPYALVSSADPDTDSSFTCLAASSPCHQLEASGMATAAMVEFSDSPSPTFPSLTRNINRNHHQPQHEMSQLPSTINHCTASVSTAGGGADGSGSVKDANSGAILMTCFTSSADGGLMTSSVIDVGDDEDLANHVSKHTTATVV